LSTLEVVDIALTALLITAVITAVIWLWIKDREFLKLVGVCVWAFWLVVGWAVAFIALMSATTATAEYVGFGLLAAYAVAWLPIAAS